MGGSKLHEGFEQPATSNGAQYTKQEIMEAYETKVLDKEGEERSKGRNYVEGMAFDFLVTVQHVMKFCHVIVELLNRSATGIKHWNPAAAAKAFRHIEDYAINLWEQPWRKEYKTIKLYSGFYKTQIEPHILGAEDLFKMMGYEGTPNTLVMRVNSSREQLIQTAVEAFMLSAECNVYYMILQRVEHLGYTILDVHQCRLEFAAEIDPSIEWISKNRTPFKRKSAQPLEKIEQSVSESSETGDGWTRGSSVKHTVNNIEGHSQQQMCNSSPHTSILRNGQPGNRGKQCRVSADSGLGSKPASKEITPIEENDETEVDPPSPEVAKGRTRQLKKDEQAGAKCDKDPYAVGTAEEHQFQSLKLVEGLNKKKPSSKAVDTPIPPPRQKSKEWDHVTERLTNQYGHKYFEGPRGDILQLNDTGTASGQSKGTVNHAALPAGVMEQRAEGHGSLGPVKVKIPVVPPPKTNQEVDKSAPLQQQKPLVVNLPSAVQHKRVISNNDMPGGTHAEVSGCAEYRSESLGSKIKRPPSAEDILEEVLKNDEQHKSTHNDFTTFGKPSLPPPRPSRSKKNSAARKSTYDNVPGYPTEQYKRGELVGRGISASEADFYSENLVDSMSRPGRQVSPMEESSAKGKSYEGGDYGFNVNVTNVNATNRRRQLAKGNQCEACNLPSPKDLWQCQACTYANKPGTDVCEICSKSREVGEEGTRLVTGGPQCPSCTLVNSQGQQQCRACEADLRGSATYI